MGAEGKEEGERENRPGEDWARNSVQGLLYKCLFAMQHVAVYACELS